MQELRQSPAEILTDFRFQLSKKKKPAAWPALFLHAGGWAIGQKGELNRAVEHDTVSFGCVGSPMAVR
ncbi:hypothetical protein BIY27_22430 [Gibbsiella quercinecans]|nr:hypothetical protein BIY27_22430 [Gibbsiella quercinecans]